MYIKKFMDSKKEIIVKQRKVLTNRLNNMELKIPEHASDLPFLIVVPKFDSPDIIETMNMIDKKIKQKINTMTSNDMVDAINNLNFNPDRYYERMDCELFTWDSIVDIVDRDRTLEELLIAIHDKYPINILSFILRKSQGSVLNKLNQLGLHYTLENINQNITEYKYETELYITDEYLKLVFKNGGPEIEKWLAINFNYPYFQKRKVHLEDVNFKEVIKNFIETEDDERLFKLLVNMCVMLKIPFGTENTEDGYFIFYLNFKDLPQQKKEYLDAKQSIKLLKNIS